MILWTVLIGYTVNAQTIELNGTADQIINGITISKLLGSGTTVNSLPGVSCSASVTSTGYTFQTATSTFLTFNFSSPIVGYVDVSMNWLYKDEIYQVSTDTGIFQLQNTGTNCIIVGPNYYSGVSQYGSSNDGGTVRIKLDSPTNFLKITASGSGLYSFQNFYLTVNNVLGVDDVNIKAKNNTINIFPNPVKNNFTISSKEGLKSYKIFDESGREISSSLLKGTQDEVNMSSALPGNYTIIIETEKQKITKKLLKQ